MAAGDLATQWASASGAMILTKFSQNIPVLAPEGFNIAFMSEFIYHI